MAAQDDVLAEIRDLRPVPDVTGVLVATVDGLLVAHDTRGIEPETVAAMSAAQLGSATSRLGLPARWPWACWPRSPGHPRRNEDRR